MCCIRPWYEISASIETETNATTASPAIMRFFHSVKMMEDWSTSAQWFWFRYCLCQSLDLRIPRMPYVPLSCQFLPKNVRINVCVCGTLTGINECDLCHNTTTNVYPPETCDQTKCVQWHEWIETIHYLTWNFRRCIADLSLCVYFVRSQIDVMFALSIACDDCVCIGVIQYWQLRCVSNNRNIHEWWIQSLGGQTRLRQTVSRKFNNPNHNHSISFHVSKVSFSIPDADHNFFSHRFNLRHSKSHNVCARPINAGKNKIHE